MSYFEDQEDAWLANNCKGSPDQYDPHSADVIGAWVNQPKKKRKPRKAVAVHCLSCGSEVLPDGRCPKVKSAPQKKGNLLLLVNCGNTMA